MTTMTNSTTSRSKGGNESGKGDDMNTTAKNPYKMPRLQIDSNGNWTSSVPTEGGIDPRKGGLLSFGNGNAKLKALRQAAADKLNIDPRKVRILTLTLPAGFSCPGASECLAFADPMTGQVWDSPTLKFRCFEASAERYENVRQQNWHNFNLLRRLKVADDMAELILASLESATSKFKADDVVIVRIHVGGDFYSKAYLQGWNKALRASQQNPMRIIGYAYTKSLHHVASLAPEDMGLETLADNFVLTASEGGRFDWLIEQIAIKSVKVVYTPEQAESEGLEIDHDDSHAVFGQESFGLLIHGTQPKGTKPAKALSSLKARGIESGYSEAALKAYRDSIS